MKKRITLIIGLSLFGTGFSALGGNDGSASEGEQKREIYSVADILRVLFPEYNPDAESFEHESLSEKELLAIRLESLDWDVLAYDKDVPFSGMRVVPWIDPLGRRCIRARSHISSEPRIHFSHYCVNDVCFSHKIASDVCRLLGRIDGKAHVCFQGCEHHRAIDGIVYSKTDGGICGFVKEDGSIAWMQRYWIPDEDMKTLSKYEVLEEQP